MHLLIGLLIIACLFLSESTARNAPDSIHANVVAVLALTFLVPALALLQTVFVSRLWNFESLDQDERASISRRMTICHTAVWIATSLMISGWTGWQNLVRENLGLKYFPVLDDLLVVAPMLVAMLLSWGIFFDLQNTRARKTPDTVKQMNRPGRFRSWLPGRDRIKFIGIRARLYLLLALVPVLIFAILRDFTDLSRFPPAVAFSVLLVVATSLVIGFPDLVCFIWNIKPVECRKLRQELLEICHKNQVRVKDVRIWHTQNQVVNAMVVGLVPWRRIIVISDALLERFTRAELEAIIRHEAGHIRLYHMPIRLFLVLLPLIVVGLAEAASLPGVAWTQIVLASIGLPILVAKTAPAVAYGIYLVFSLSWISRRMEFEADHYAATTARDASGTQSVLDALLRFARLDPARFERSSLLHPSIRSRMEYIGSLRDLSRGDLSRAD
ncbi:MAG: M48 family metalloprotease [Planctomycetota bacterium]